MTNSPTWIVHAIFDDDAPRGFLYTYGLYDIGKPELLVRGVPRSKVNDVASALNFLGARTVKDSEMIKSHGLGFGSKVLHKKQAKKLLKTHLCKCDHRAKVIELEPLVIPEHGTEEEYAAEWASCDVLDSIIMPEMERGDEHQAHLDTVRTIRDKWHEQTKPFRGYFIRFLDGDCSNCCADNLNYCSPHDAFSNPDWKVDWDLDLTSDEIAFVRTNMGNFRKLYAE